MAASESCIYCQCDRQFMLRNCELCDAVMCISCIHDKKLYLEYMTNPSSKHRIFRCELHGKETIRLYDTEVRVAAVESDGELGAGGLF